MLALALVVRQSGTVGFGGETWWLARGCGEALLPQVLSNLQSHNPLHFEVFFYPPVPAILVASATRVWGTLGVGGTVAALCGTVGLFFELATVGIVYLLGRFWGRPHGLIAMALYAVAMTAVVAGGNVQVYSTFFLSLATYSILRSVREGGQRIPMMAGVWLGLGVASKYSPFFFIGLLFIPYVLRRWEMGWSADCNESDGASAKDSTLAARVWAGALCALVSAAAVLLWVGVAKKGFVYGLLRQVYERHTHENPFEYHLPWIDRLYRAGLTGAGLVGLVVALAVIVPWVRKESPWEWARKVFARNRLWMVPCIVLVLTVAVALGVPAALNLNDFTRHFVGIAKGRLSGDSGMFPEHRPAPSYIGAYIPEGTGLPLFFAGLIGIVYPFIKRDRRAALLIMSAIPAYLVLELQRVKVSVYALDLFPLWCLLAAIWLGDLCQRRRKAWRVAGRVLVVCIVAYSAVYSLAWAEFFGSRITPQTEAGKWLNANVPPGTSIGARSALLVTGSPGLLPDSGFLAPYRLVEYTEEPEYVLLPNGVHAVMVQYLKSLQEGYVYKDDDWGTSIPTSADLSILSRIVRQESYVLVKEFRKRPLVLGMEVRSDSLSGRTWMAEHSSSIGLKVYHRVAARG